jgi:hypothetical protein
VGLSVGVATGRAVAVGVALAGGVASTSAAPSRQAPKIRLMKMSKQIKLFRKRTILQTTQRCSGRVEACPGSPAGCVQEVLLLTLPLRFSLNRRL